MELDLLDVFIQGQYEIVNASPENIRLQYALQYPSELEGGLRSFSRKVFDDCLKCSAIGRIVTSGPEKDTFVREMNGLNPILQGINCAVAGSMFSTGEIQGMLDQIEVERGTGLVLKDDNINLKLITCPYLVIDPNFPKINRLINVYGGIILQDNSFIKVMYGVQLQRQR